MPAMYNDGFKILLLSSLFYLQAPTIWSGFACLSNPCVHGVCLDDLNSTYFCYCIDGYTGIQCQTNWNECWSNPCHNGGICIDGIAMFNCSCPPGFLGDLCEEDFNECDSNPCLNNGTCIDGPNGYYCNCFPGYSGTHCEIDVAVCNTTDETRCLNGGYCQEGPGETFTCKCQPGWEGFLCDTEINECLSTPCQNGAICIDLHASYACACLFGFTGQNCEETIKTCQTNPCKNGALCLIEENKHNCYCVPDYHGDLCQYQYDECQLGPRCMNGGTCIDGVDNFTCSCPKNLTGILCECLVIDDHNLDCNYIGPITTSSTTTTTKYTTEPSTTTPTITSVVTETVPNIFTTTMDTTITETTTHLITTTTESTTVTTQVPETTTEITTTETSTKIIIPPENVTMSGTTAKLTTDYSTTPLETTTASITTTTTPAMTTTTLETITTTLASEELTTIETTTKTTTEAVPITLKPITSTESTTTSIGLNITSTPGEIVSSTFSSTLSSFLTDEPRSISDGVPITSTTTMGSTIITTTEIPTTTSSIPHIDCTKSDSKCQNGGTCIYTDKGHKCLCPFDTDGTFCEVNLGIRKAAFNGESYLSHRLTNFSHIYVDFNSKTLSSNGLLFYSNIDSNSYMALYVEKGYLKFKFSCGYQTMLLSEVKVPINNGYNMNIKARLDFTNDLTHCDASIRVNNSLSMTGDQTANLNKFSTPIAFLHLGGIPQEFSNENLPINGFVGCMSDLKVSGKKIDIFKAAEDGFGISECSSLACLSNPCRNGASCTPKDDSWQCHCKNGYLGRMCEVSVCDNNPCYFGGTCIPFSSSGYICLCPYGKHGHFCENDLRISEPHFSSTIRGLSSYVAYPIPDGISKNMEINFKFTPSTTEQISLLLFIGQTGLHDYYSDHIAVSFVKGYIMLTWNLGSGPRRIFTSQPIRKGARDYLVKIGHTGRRAWLFVENLGNITGRSPGNLAQLDVVPLLYLGGHDSTNFSLLPHDLPMHTGFSGCIFDVEIKSGSVLFPLQGTVQAFGRAVGQCGTTECYDQSCQNSGACLHHGSTFMCLCQDNWFGPLCSSRTNLCDENNNKCSEDSTCVPLISHYRCDCAFGKTGEFCEKDENITDVSLTGERSFIQLKPFEFDNNRVSFGMEIRPLHDQGLLFFTGRKTSSFISLYLQNNILELRMQSIKNKLNIIAPLLVRSTKLLVKGIWYKIEFGLFGRKVYLTVDNVINTGIIAAGSSLVLSKEAVYLGGLPDMSNLPISATTFSSIPYTGCVRRFSVDNSLIPLNQNTVQKGQNVVDCDGTPCGGDSCFNGGTCWLDSFMKPHCSCLQPYYGEKCENIPNCNEKGCKNNGKCYNSKCSCNVGYTGAFCEHEILVKTPEFSGRSYIIVQKSNDKKRDTGSLDLKKLYLNFTSAKPNGLLIWSKKNKNFIGVGLENGFLKLTFSFGEAKHKFIEIPSSVHISDGLWHSIEVNLSPFSIKLDKNLLELSSEKIFHNVTLSTNGVFYIGGIPTNTTLLNETHGLFHDNFEGCIDSFGTNTEQTVTNFMHFEGNEINVCDIF